LEASEILATSRLLGKKKNRERPIAVCTNADVSHKLNLGNTQIKHANQTRKSNTQIKHANQTRKS